MNETAELLDLSSRARALDAQVESLTRQNTELRGELGKDKEKAKEAQNEASEARRALEAYERLAKGEIARLDAQIKAERQAHQTHLQEVKAQTLQERADIVTERNDLRESLERWERNAGQAGAVLIEERKEHEAKINSLKAQLTEANRLLPCGHHHSLDDNDGGCLLCGNANRDPFVSLRQK